MKKVSVVITVLNEEKSIKPLLLSLLSQSKKADEIIVVDGRSSDRTVEKIKALQEKNEHLKLMIKKSSRSKGRNIGVKVAKNEIIAMTDADCKAKKNWLKHLTEPFTDDAVDMVAGFYNMVASTSFQKSLSVFLGITPEIFTEDFLPSTRSIAFRKRLWKKVGGFKGGDENTAEDTIFNYQATQIDAKIIRKQEALVDWHIPKSLLQALKKLYIYAQWDVQSRILWHPLKKYSSHNIKVILIFVRYLVGVLLLYFSIYSFIAKYLFIIATIGYCVWAFRKVFIKTHAYKASLWGIILQFSSDIAVMSGAFTGLLKRKTEIE